MKKFHPCLPAVFNTLATLVGLFLLAGCISGRAGNRATREAQRATQEHTWSVIFDGGSVGYHTYRIPSLVRTSNGTLIAFAEGRRLTPQDWSDIDLVYKRSTDNGATWSPLGIVVDSGKGTWGNPTAVYDGRRGPNGRVWLFLSWNDSSVTTTASVTAWGMRKVYVTYSDDHGLHWATLQDLTSSLVPADHTWDAVGPGIGIQTTVVHPGRLIIPAQRRNIYSDDGGETWQYQLLPPGTGEATIVERPDGTLLRNDRVGGWKWERSQTRYISIGSIEKGFSPWQPDTTLVDPKCEASILRFDSEGRTRLLFLNPANTRRRGRMTVRLSYDGGRTWPISRRMHEWLTEQQTIDGGKGGYSSMITTADDRIGALIEVNEDVSKNKTSHKSIEFHKFNLAWLLQGIQEPEGFQQ